MNVWLLKTNKCLVKPANYILSLFYIASYIKQIDNILPLSAVIHTQYDVITWQEQMATSRRDV